MVAACKKYTNFLPLLILIFLTGVSPAVDAVAQTNYLINSSAFTRAGIQYWASGGAVAQEGLPSAAVNNPAALSVQTLTLYAEAGKQSEDNWLFDLNYDGQWIAPSYVSLSLPVNDWSLSVGYANSYDYYLSTGPIAVTTEAMPEGTGQFFEFERSVVVHTIFGSAGYHSSENLSLGLTLGLNVITLKDGFDELQARANGLGALGMAGVIYRPVPTVGIGGVLTLRSKVDMNASYAYPPSSLIPIDPGSGVVLVQVPPEVFAFRASFPWTIAAGVDWRFLPAAELMFGLEYQHWSGVSNTNVNPFQARFGAAISLSPAVKLRLGLFTATEPVASVQTFLNQNFLSAGLDYRLIDNLTLVAGILDSHLLSGTENLPSFSNVSKTFRQTFVSLGAMYTR